jgi:hypothetical protein
MNIETILFSQRQVGFDPLFFPQNLQHPFLELKQRFREGFVAKGVPKIQL